MVRQKVAFFGLCLGFFMVMMDTTTVPLIYTVLIDEYQVTPAGVAWVNNSYLITYAGFLLFGGRLGDAFNRKVILSLALFMLAIGALLSGSGETLLQVVIGRAIMGIGAGLLAPQSMAFISVIFAKGGRGAALGVWGAVAGIATATGPVITQFFLQTADWRWVMWINIPIALLALGITFICLPNTEGNGVKKAELLSCGLFGTALIAIMLGIDFLHGDSKRIVIGGVSLLSGIAGIVLLIRGELKNNTQHLLPTELWQDRPFLRTCLVSGLLGFGLTAFYLPLAFLMELRMNLGPVSISIIMVTIALSNALVGPLAGYFSDKSAPETIIRAGMLCFAIANLIIASSGLLFSASNIGFIIVVTGMALAGIGTGLSFAPLANLAFSRASFTNFGRAAAFFNVVRQLMSALGSVAIAVLFDYIINLDVISESSSLKSASATVALAAFICFLVIACFLGAGAWLSRTNHIIQPAIKET
ncbi:MFS transporter [Pantoea sp. FN0307]|uniref:MFS transporter n=1 Tax=Pantoea sp. FN0307 TaxID=3418560 RepID=UPI003CFB98A0